MGRSLAAASNQYLQLAGSVLPSGTGLANFHCFLSCWFYPTANIQEGLVAVQKAGVVGSLQGWGLRYISSLNVYGAYVQDASGNFQEARSTAQVQNKWVNLIAMYDPVGATPIIDLWVGGTLVNFADATVVSGTITPDKTTIGANYYGALQDYATGNISDVSIWYFGTGAQSAFFYEAAHFLAAGGSPLQLAWADASLVGYWPLRGSNPELDLSRYRRHMTLYGSPAWAPDPNLAKPTDFAQYGFGTGAPASTARSFAVMVG